MDSTQANEMVAHDLSPLIRIYKDGRIERLLGTVTVPPSTPDPQTGVYSKDVLISAESSVSTRLYLPKLPDPRRKIPILVYFHGGGFVIESPSSPTYHSFLNSLLAQANVLAVSVGYRLAPEHPLPAAYDDSWAALQWVASAADPWLAEHGDFSSLVVAGDSAGANIAHQMAMRSSGDDLGRGVKLYSAVLIHPYFWGSDALGSVAVAPLVDLKVTELWRVAFPSTEGVDDPRINPMGAGAPSLARLGCRRVLVCVAEKDLLRDKGWAYYKSLASSGWKGVVEMAEAEGEGHVFHLLKPDCENASALMQRLAAFLNGDGVPLS